MRIDRLALVLLPLLAACSANKSAPMSPPPGAQAPAAESPPPPPPSPAATMAPPSGGGMPSRASSAAPTPDGGATPESPKPTTPTADASPSGPTQRLEDVKQQRATGSSGSYTVAVRSAAGLVPDDVGKAINGASSKTDACFAKAIKKKPAAGSATTFEVVIDGRGAGATKLLSDATKDADWTKCLEGALKGVTWPKPSEKNGKTTIEFTVGG